MNIKRLLCATLSFAMILGNVAPTFADPVSCTHENKSYGSIVWTNDDCTQGGSKHWSCDDCSEEGDETVSATTHSYSGGVCVNCGSLEPASEPCTHENKTYGSIVWTDNDCTKGGSQGWTCDNPECGETGTNPVNAMTHSYTDGVCVNCGMAEPQAETVKVIFDSNGGSAVATQTITKGTSATQPANPTKTNYTFVKWQLNDADYDFATPVNADITLKAVWKVAEHTPTGGKLIGTDYTDGDCTKGGTAHYDKCSICQEPYDVAVEPYSKHLNTNYANKCDRCGIITSHSHTGGVLDSEAYKNNDCTQGITTNYADCEKCGESYTKQEAGYDAHNFVNNVCTRCGKTQPCTHSSKKYTSVDEKHHKITCKTCGITIKESESCDFDRYVAYDDDDSKYEKYHKLMCTSCDNYKKEEHTLKYEYKSGNKHKVYCKECNFAEREACEFESNNKCKKCEHTKDGSSTPYVPASVQTARNNGTALPANTITMTSGGKAIDVAAEQSEPRDQANQYLIAYVMLTQQGYDQLIPTKTYKMTAYGYNIASGQATLTWSNCGLQAGDTAFVVYWNPTAKTQLLPVQVGANGSASFTVPDINGAIMTLVKASKSAPTTTKASTKKTSVKKSTPKASTSTAKEEVKPEEKTSTSSDKEVQKTEPKEVTAPSQSSSNKTTSSVTSNSKR